MAKILKYKMIYRFVIDGWLMEIFLGNLFWGKWPEDSGGELNIPLWQGVNRCKAGQADEVGRPKIAYLPKAMAMALVIFTMS
jgi:hypothetical protein